MPSTVRQRVDAADWDAATADMNDVGGALLPRLITPTECAAVLDLYPDDGLFRATIDMNRYRYGQGEYRYFDRPYPHPIDELKQALYPRLLPIARDWWAKLRRDAPWPDSLDEWLEMCHRAGQTKSTAILLKYGPGDWKRCTETSTETSSFRCKSSSISTNRAWRTPAANSFSSSSDPAHSRAARRPRCRKDTATSSPPGNDRSARLGDGRPPQCGTECPSSAPVSATPSA
jgi:hypothetical protein